MQSMSVDVGGKTQTSFFFLFSFELISEEVNLLAADDFSHPPDHVIRSRNAEEELFIPCISCRWETQNQKHNSLISL